MKQHLKALLGIWLTVILLISMVPVNAFAETYQIWLWKSPDSVSEKFDDAYIENADLDNQTPLNEQFVFTDGSFSDVELQGWNLWTMKLSGVFSLDRTYKKDEVIQSLDSNALYLLEPEWTNVRIAKQPEKSNNYTAEVELYMQEGSAPSYRWLDARRAQTENANLTYQWYRQEACELTVSVPAPGLLSAGGASENTLKRNVNLQYYDDFDRDTNTLYSDEAMLGFTLSLEPGDTVSLTLNGENPPQLMLGPAYEIGRSFKLFDFAGAHMQNGSISLRNTSSTAITYYAMLFSNDEFSFDLSNLSITAAVSLKGRTGASLLDVSGDADPLVPGKNYFCKVSFEDSGNHVYKAYGDLVNYTSETLQPLPPTGDPSQLGQNDLANDTDETLQPLPPTGDSAQLSLWIGMAMLSVLGIVFLRKKV